MRQGDGTRDNEGKEEVQTIYNSHSRGSRHAFRGSPVRVSLSSRRQREAPFRGCAIVTLLRLCFP